MELQLGEDWVKAIYSSQASDLRTQMFKRTQRLAQEMKVDHSLHLFLQLWMGPQGLLWDGTGALLMDQLRKDTDETESW